MSVLVAQIGEIATFVGRSAFRNAPFFILSIALTVLIGRSRLRTVLADKIQQRPRQAVIWATVLGALSPLCSCGVIPFVSGLLLLGIPLAPIMSFWITSPLMDPSAFVMTAGIFDLRFAIERLLAAVAVGLLAGWVTWTAERRGALGLPSIRLKLGSACCQTVQDPAPSLGSATSPALPAWPTNAVTATTHNPRSSRAEIWDEAWRLALYLGSWLLLAFVVEALLVRYLPASSAARWLGTQTWAGVPVAVALGIPLYVNNVGGLPIAHGLLATGMSRGAVLAFLVAGPVTSVPAMLAVLGIAGRRIFVLYLALGIIGALGAGYVLDLVELFAR